MIDEKKLIEDVSMLSKLINTYVKNIVHYVPTKCDNADEIISQCKNIRKVATSFGVIINNQPKVDKWIPVSENYPTDESKEYLCCEDSKRIHMYGFSKDLYRLDCYDFIQYKDKAKAGFYDYDSEWGYRHCDDVVAWMPLPEPYKDNK